MRLKIANGTLVTSWRLRARLMSCVGTASSNRSATWARARRAWTRSSTPRAAGFCGLHRPARPLARSGAHAQRGLCALHARRGGRRRHHVAGDAECDPAGDGRGTFSSSARSSTRASRAWISACGAWRSDPTTWRTSAACLRAGAVGVKLFWGYALDRHTRMLVYNLGDSAPEDLIPPPANGEVLELCREVARVGGLLARTARTGASSRPPERQLGGPLATYADVLRARPDTAEAVSIAVASRDERRHRLSLPRRAHRVAARHSGRAARASRWHPTDRRRRVPTTCRSPTRTSRRIGGMMKVYPPIRTAADSAALWEAVRDGTITSIGSDHAPHTIEEKSLGLASAPAGISGVQTLGAVLIDAMLDGKLGSREVGLARCRKARRDCMACTRARAHSRRGPTRTSRSSIPPARRSSTRSGCTRSSATRPGRVSDCAGR